MKKTTKITADAINRIKSATSINTGGIIPKKSFAARAESALTKGIAKTKKG